MKTIADSKATLFFYKIVGYFMLCWYGAVRWTIFADSSVWDWAYKPINLITALSSIVFIIPTLLMPFSTKSKFIYFLGIFLAFRNMYYTIEDIIDFPSNPPLQAVFILLDVVMLVYCLMFIMSKPEFNGELGVTWKQK